MIIKAFFRHTAILAALGLFTPGHTWSAPKTIPEPLQAWEDWVTWGHEHQNCPTPYHTADHHICFWPSTLSLETDHESGSWTLGVTTFDETWVPLPGGTDTWPFNVKNDTNNVVVVEHKGHPSVRLPKGSHRLTGEFRWDDMPQQIQVPQQVGLLRLSRDGKAVEVPNWDAAGRLWLKRAHAEATAEDHMAVQLYRVIEDGIPMWLRTEIELSVSGKSREVELGWALPEGWKLALVESPIPVAVNDQGRIKVQVRAGKWIVQLHAFRTTDLSEVRFREGEKPVVDQELVAFLAKPNFRVADIEGIQPVDVTQTTFPEKWRSFPVYRWDTDTTFRVVEKMRGMGLKRPDGLSIRRDLWLDENGKGMTFRDQIHGRMQQVWRLDIAEGQELGAVRENDQGQLITRNPETGAHGVEIRAREMNLTAVGKTDVRDLSASGWRTDTDSLAVKINLPPGWRLFALFGSDWVHGDWLTTWTLLDLFLLLIFSLAVFKLWGWQVGLLAFVAFGLAYHEPNAPRWTWLFLLMPLALLGVVRQEGVGRTCVVAWKFISVALLVIYLVPFIAFQIQSAMYPQLEPTGVVYQPRGLSRTMGHSHRVNWEADNVLIDHVRASEDMPQQAILAETKKLYDYNKPGRGRMKRWASTAPSQNLGYDPKAKIQTGPAVPEWRWNQVQCGWNGPVSEAQKIRPILISLSVHRVLTVLRIVLLLMLTGALLGVRLVHPFSRRAAGMALFLLMMTVPQLGSAEFPNRKMLDELQTRLHEKPPVYPHGAAIPDVLLTIADDHIVMEAEVHCAVEAAVPLPGRLPSWSPVSVMVNGEFDTPLRRDQGYLWVVLPEGVHQVRVEGLRPNKTEWEWTFFLPPKRVSVEAPGWQVTGIRPNGIPEKQIFFAQQKDNTEEEAAYDRKDFHAVVAVDRYMEVGLTWQVHTEITRLSAPGKAVSLRIPLLAQEKVLTSDLQIRDGFVDVRLGSDETTFSWNSQLPVGEDIPLQAQETDRWVERWHLITSPVWHGELSGLSPIFEPSEKKLIPVWHPWPGERVLLSFSKPEAVSGDTMTVGRITHETVLGSRQRTATLRLEIECSLGNDFLVGLNPTAEISSLKKDGQGIPVRRDGAILIVPVHPGKQQVDVAWKTDEAIATQVQAGKVSLPVDAANITSVIQVPESRWILWAQGPMRGPAVRFWALLVVALVTAWILGSLPLSPLSKVDWMLLAVGLTQVYLIPALLLVVYFFLLAWRGKVGHEDLSPRWFNLLQLLLVVLAGLSLIVLVVSVSAGLLGHPEMFIRGNNSSRTYLQWFQPSTGTELPTPTFVSVSVWTYRFLMLAWALWLATALIRWLKWGWEQFSSGGYCWKRPTKKPKKAPPPVISPP